MHVKVKNSLPAICVGVNDNPVSVFRETLFTGYISCGHQQMSKSGAVCLVRPVQRIDMFARDYQNMRRSLRAKVIKCNANIVLKNEVRRYATIGYLTENTDIQAHIIRPLNHKRQILLMTGAASILLATRNFRLYTVASSVEGVKLSLIRSISAPSELSFLTMVS